MKTPIIWASIAILAVVPLRAQQTGASPSPSSAPDVAAMQQQIRDLQDRLIALEGQVRMERKNGHRFITELVEAFPGEISAISVSKPSLEDVFIRRTGHKFWTEGHEETQP